MRYSQKRMNKIHCEFHPTIENKFCTDEMMDFHNWQFIPQIAISTCKGSNIIRLFSGSNYQNIDLSRFTLLHLFHINTYKI